MDTDKQEAKQKVLDWLDAAPFDDPEAAAKSPDFSYEAWLKDGQSMPRSVELLVELLGEENPKEPSGRGHKMAYALGWFGDETAVEPLEKALASEDVNVRVEAAQALGRRGSEAQFETLKKLIKSNQEDANVRANACIGLGHLGAPGSKELLTETLEDNDPFVAQCAKEGLRVLAERHPDADASKEQAK